jgi:signal transduction histidine kinase
VVSGIKLQDPVLGFMIGRMRSLSSPFISRLRWALLSFAFWTAVGLVSALPLLGESTDLRKTLLSAMADWWSWGLLLPGIIALDRSLPFSSRQLARRVIAQLVLAPIVSIGYRYVLAFMQAAIHLEPWSSLLGKGVLIGATRGIFWSMLEYCVIVGAWETYQYQRQYLSAELQMERLERTSSEAHLNALRMQLDPHFLFNALNTISAQVEREPKLARKMIEHLGDLLRLSLQSHGKQEIPLSEELSFLDHYLAIQEIRFGDKLRFEMKISPEVEQALVPSLLIQPIVENAIRHGISKRARGGFIQLTAECLNNRLLLRVLDDGVGLPPNWTLESQTGLGLSLTRERIAVLHPGDASRFDVLRRSGGGTEVVISFPIRMVEKLEEVSDGALVH